MTHKVTAYASPNIALIKYWGKSERGFYPATSSLGVTLSCLKTSTEIFIDRVNSLYVNGEKQEFNSKYFDKARSLLKIDSYLRIFSQNNFPTASGIASSASGFAALSEALFRLVSNDFTKKEVSSLSREGSISAARSVFEGFVALEREAKHAYTVFDKDYWSTLKIIVVMVGKEKKSVSSREAMKLSQETSPLWRIWLENSEVWFQESLEALKKKDLEKLGYLMGLSYRSMFSVMFTSNPSIIYWRKESLELIQACHSWRREGIGCWETMDAGPHVKIFVEKKDLSFLVKKLQKNFSSLSFFIDEVGMGSSSQRLDL